MTTIQTTSSKRKQKQIKGKNRSRHHISLGTPQVPLTSVPHQQQHELLSDWSDAS